MVIKAARRSPTGAHGRELAGHQSTGSQRTLIRPDTRDTAAVPDFEFAVIEERTLRAFVRARVERKKPCYPMRVLSERDFASALGFRESSQVKSSQVD